MSETYGVIGVQIPANQALSGEVDLGGANLLAIEMPEGWSGTIITFQAKAVRHSPASVGQEAEDWDDVYDDTGTEVSVTVGANRIVVIGTVTKAAIAALRFIRVRSGTAAAPFGQNPTREIRLITKKA